MRISDWSSDVCSSDLLTFDVHVPDDVPAGAVLVARNGVVVTKTCTAPGVAAPDPCEASRSRTGDTLRMTVHSTRASQWDLVVPSVLDRKSVVTGKSVSVRVNLGGCRIFKKKKNK